MLGLKLNHINIRALVMDMLRVIDRSYDLPHSLCTNSVNTWDNLLNDSEGATPDVDGLVQDSIAIAMEILQSYIKPSISSLMHYMYSVCILKLFSAWLPSS